MDYRVGADQPVDVLQVSRPLLIDSSKPNTSHISTLPTLPRYNLARMFPFRANQSGRTIPVLTYTLIFINVVIYFWDRQWNFSLNSNSVLFADLAMRPVDVLRALKGETEWFPMVTAFTCMFLHANVMHLAGNMLFMLVFGAAVESAIGAPRFALYYLAWGFFASAAQFYVDPHSVVPIVGASGAIGGVLGSYFLLFPTSRIEVLLPYIWLPLEVSAWILLGVWFLWQVFGHQQGVANWAHAGGFMAGMATVLIMGGRRTILKGRESEFEDELG